ncbi:hypothetical protein [Xenophilus sp.]|uniref:hypothetical protein n=1 Tax=Xenophilus sp. TaxID=1873499 RepID=UPI0037DC9BC7
MSEERSVRSAAVLAAYALALAACGESAQPPAPAAAPPAPAPAAGAPAPAAPPPVVAAPAPAAAPAAPRQVPMSVQGTASAGLTVRVKSVEMGEDATILDISASFENRRTNFTNLAESETYLADSAGNRLMLKRPPDNRYLRIMSGDTMQGRLVFLGSVPPSETQLRLVINDGMPPDSTAGPGLAIALPLKPAGGS